MNLLSMKTDCLLDVSILLVSGNGLVSLFQVAIILIMQRTFRARNLLNKSFPCNRGSMN